MKNTSSDFSLEQLDYNRDFGESIAQSNNHLKQLLDSASEDHNKSVAIPGISIHVSIANVPNNY